MAKKKTETETEDQTPEAVELTVGREHVDFPHSIELRRNGGEHVLEARLEDHRHSHTLGAKTVEAILQENGTELPTETGGELVIRFSPYNGEIMAITQKEKSLEKGTTKNEIQVS